MGPVGLDIDCSQWVEAGLITHAGMLDRNWALWTTFCQVHLTTRRAYSFVDVTLQDTTWSLHWTRILYNVVCECTSHPGAIRHARFGSIHGVLAAEGK
jgi:hypothetical protein